MPDVVIPFLALPGLGLLIIVAFVAGVVRGFSGFGTAMIYLPVAGGILSPLEALTTLVCMDLVGPVPNLRRAIRDGTPDDILRLSIGLVIALPLGVWALSLVAPQVFRYGVSIITFVLLVLLISGFRYRRSLTPAMVTATGGLGGFLAGSVGLPGPPVIMVYMGAALPVSAIRANITLFLFMGDIAMLVVLWVFGHLVPSAIGLGLVLMIPNLLGNIAGARLFRPRAERNYRVIAYSIIAFSAVSGLPLWD